MGRILYLYRETQSQTFRKCLIGKDEDYFNDECDVISGHGYLAVFTLSGQLYLFFHFKEYKIYCPTLCYKWQWSWVHNKNMQNEIFQLYVSTKYTYTYIAEMLKAPVFSLVSTTINILHILGRCEAISLVDGSNVIIIFKIMFKTNVSIF